MIDELQLFRGKDYVLNEHITIHQPTLTEICEYGEQRYYGMVLCLCSTPSDYKVQLLDQFSIDYEKISELEFFYTMSQGISRSDTSILFGQLDLQKLSPAQNKQNEELVLYDSDNDIVIDQTLYTLMISYLRTVHGFSKKTDCAGNAHTKKYILDKERRKLQRRRNEAYKSMLLPLISAMVNCEQFKYDHGSVWNLPLYAFLDSVKRIQKLKTYDQMMQGIYAGTLDYKSLSDESLNWMGSLGES